MVECSISGELYARRLQNLIYRYLFTDCSMKISLQSSEKIYMQSLVSFHIIKRSVFRKCFTIVYILPENLFIMCDTLT